MTTSVGITKLREAHSPMAEKRYLTWCEQCYSCHLLETNSRKEAATRATSHMTAYRHSTHVTDRKASRTEDSVS